jgi:benzoyl-CoA reductase/2-hydroxyglutaryl-CoA dehydratase subunit BcrC/BadD/HgdB
VLSSSLICDNNAKIGDVIMHLVKSPGFFLDYPFQRTGLETDYLKNELMEMIHFLEKESGQKMDWHKLKEGIARLDKQIETAREIQKLRRNTPSPFIPMDFLKMFTADCLYPGEAEATEYIETLHSELAEKVKAGKGIGYPEKFRILSIGIPPILLQRAVEQTLSEHGAVSVTDPYSCTWEEGRLDADDPLENVIHKIRMLPSSMFYGPLTDRVAEKVVQDAQTYKVDGAIFYAHIGCRQSSAMIKLIKEALNSIDIPILVLDCDIVDITVTPEEDLCHKLQQFFELLEDR